MYVRDRINFHPTLNITPCIYSHTHPSSATHTQRHSITQSELVHFASIIKSLVENGDLEIGKCYVIDVFLQIKENDLLESFPNVYTMLCIYLCIFVANCKGERSFSKLKLILNFLRNTMGQERLSSLALLSIENQLLRTLDFSDVINEFASIKARRKDF